MRPVSVLVPEWSWLPPFLFTVRVAVGARRSGLTDLPADRRRSFGKGRSPARLSPQAGDRKGARRWLVLRSGYLPGEYPAHTAARSRSRLPFSTQAARAFSSEHKASIIGQGAVVDTFVAFFQNGSHDTTEGSPGGMIVNPGRRTRRPDEDLQRVGAVEVVVAVGYVPVLGPSRFLQKRQDVRVQKVGS